jgi:hypothetical protein
LYTSKFTSEYLGIPDDPIVRPVKMVQEVQENATRVAYDPITGTASRGGNYVPSEDEKKTDEEIKKRGGN